MILFLRSEDLSAQPWTQLYFEHYTEEDGLPGNKVNLTVQDHQGYIWIGTSAGLCKFDGTNWTSYAAIPNVSKSITNTSVISIYHDQKKRVWFGTQTSGVNMFHQLTGELTNYNYSSQDSSTIAGTTVTGIFEDRHGRIWVCANGLNLYDEKLESFTRIQPTLPAHFTSKTRGWANTLRFIQYDPNDPDIVWLYSSFGLMKFNTRTFTSTSFFPHEVEHATRMAIMDGQTIWMTNYGVGLYAFDIVSNTFHLYHCDADPQNLLGCQSAASLIELDDRYLLITSYTEYLYLFDRQEQAFHFRDRTWPASDYHDPEGILMKDREGRLWISTHGSGLYVQQKQFGHFKKHPVQGDLQDILQVKDHIYACSAEGQLVVIDPVTTQPERSLPITTRAGQPTSPIKLHTDEKGRLWILSRRALHSLSSDQKSTISWNAEFFEKEGITYNYFWDLTSDPVTGRIWLATQSSGLFGYSPEKNDLYTFSKNKSSTNHIRNDYSIGSLQTDKSNCIWGFNGSGYFKVDPATEIVLNSPTPVTSSLDQRPFIGDHLMCMTDDGTIWVCAGHGRLAKITDTLNLSQHLEEVEFSPTILNDRANDILADQDGHIWISSAHGLFRYHPGTHQVDHFGKQVGLEEINGLSLDPEGHILAATKGGYYRFDPSTMIPFEHRPFPVIESFRVFDTPYAIPEDPSPKITLTYEQNFFSFEFSAIDFTGKSKKEFAYILEGINDDWILAGDRRYAAFTNIGGGTFTFKVKVRNEYGSWSDPVTLDITIVPPIWERTWFWALISILLIGLAYLAYSYRIAQIKKKEQLKAAFSKQLAEVEMKALRAQMNPHFLFNSLNAIKYYVLKRSKEKAAEYLTDFARLIRLVLNNSSQSIIPLDKELEALELYIRIERLRFDEKFDYNLNIDPELDTSSISIPPLLIQPFVENAIWHGLMHKTNSKGLLSLTIRKIANGIECIIEDNGIGRKRAAEVKSKSAQYQKSFGLSITKDRMAMSKILNNIDLTTEIQDLYENDHATGTKIIVRMTTNGLSDKTVHQ
ncbi:MAG: histidine kinase [Saprospiraceae bacterium]|nr:histidine kinase [Saprospiraceae bacterium]